MRIAQIAPLTEAIPPKLYGGTERVIYWLTEELVALGHEVTLFGSGDSCTSATLEAMWPRALRLDDTVRDPTALHVLMIEHVMQAVMHLADCVYVLNNGQLIAAGAPAAIANSPQVIEAYLGHGTAARLRAEAAHA